MRTDLEIMNFIYILQILYILSMELMYFVLMYFIVLFFPNPPKKC